MKKNEKNTIQKTHNNLFTRLYIRGAMYVFYMVGMSQFYKVFLK